MFDGKPISNSFISRYRDVNCECVHISLLMYRNKCSQIRDTLVFTFVVIPLRNRLMQAICYRYGANLVNKRNENNNSNNNKKSTYLLKKE